MEIWSIQRNFQPKWQDVFFQEEANCGSFSYIFQCWENYLIIYVNNALFLIWKINLHCWSEKLKTQTILFSPFDKKASQKSILALVEAIKSPKTAKKAKIDFKDLKKNPFNHWTLTKALNLRSVVHFLHCNSSIILFEWKCWQVQHSLPKKQIEFAKIDFWGP